MAEVEEKNKEIAPDAEIDAAAEGALKARLNRREKTTGEKIYNRTVYTGIGFAANEIGSMWFTGIFERGKNSLIGKERFDQVVSWMTRKWNFKKGEKSARNLLMWTSLNVIGCFVVPAIKLVDNHKAGLIKWLNHRFGSGGMSQAEMDARDREVEKAVACEPTQSWLTLSLGRLVTIASNLFLGQVLIGTARNQQIQTAFDKGATKAANAVGLKKFTGGQMYHPDVPAHEMSRFHYYAQLAGPETIGCGSGAIVLEVVSKFFAKHWPHFKNPEVRAQALAEEKQQLLAGFKAEKPAGGETAAPRDAKTFAAEKPAASYVEKVASEPQPTLQAGV